MADNTTRDLIAGQKQTNKKLDSLNETIKKQMGDVSDAVKKPPKKDIEGKKEAQQNQKNFLSQLLTGINKAMKGAISGVNDNAVMLGKFLKMGLGFIMVPFLGLIGAIAGVISGIMKTKEVKFMLGILKTIGKNAIGFVKFMGSIARWILDLGSGGRLGTGLSNIFGKMGKTISNMFGGWTAKIGTFLKNPKIVKVMEKVSKFIRPLARVAFWLFSAWEFLKGWKQADEIFGKGEGEATIVEKFAGGIGAIIQFLSFGFIDTEKAAHALKDTFDFFKLAITKPGEAWKKITDWWDAFSFKESIVDPMVKMFDDFPKKVKDFINGPLSNFGSSMGTMMKNFIFGKQKDGEDAETGGLVGLIKGIFTAKNISAAIGGIIDMGTAFGGMMVSIAMIPFFGTGEWKLMDWDTWGGIFGAIVKSVKAIGNLEGKDVKQGLMNATDIGKSILQFIGSIFWHDDGKTGLIQKLLAWFHDLIVKFDVVAKLKALVPDFARSMFFEEDRLKKVEEEKKAAEAKAAEEAKRRKKVLDQFKEEQKKGVTWYNPESWFTRPQKEDVDLRDPGADRRKAEEFQERQRKFRRINAAKASDLLNVDISGTGQAGFDKLSDDSKIKTNLLAKLLGGARMTSGARSKETGDKAMLWSKDGMRKYRKKWRDLLTDQDIPLDSAPGSEDRKRAIKALRDGGMSSQHEHGNAIDFSYPYPFSKENFSGLKTTLIGAFPGATVVPESDHVHMQFDRNTSGMQVAKLQSESGILNRAGGSAGASGGSTTTIIGGDSPTTTVGLKGNTRDPFVAESKV